MPKYSTIPLTQKDSNPSLNLTPKEFEERLELSLSLKSSFPFLIEEHLKYLCGLVESSFDSENAIRNFLKQNYPGISEVDSSLIIKQSSPRVKKIIEAEDEKMTGGIQGGVKGRIHQTLDFFGGPLTTDSGLVNAAHLRQMEDNEKKQKEDAAIKVFTTVSDFYEGFLIAPFKFSEVHIQRTLSSVHVFLSLQQGINISEEYRTRILDMERYLKSHLKFLNLRSIFEELKTGKYDSETKAKELIRSIGEFQHLRWKSEFQIIVGFVDYIKSARNLNYEMDKELRKLEVFFSREKQSIYNIPEENILSFASVLKRFHELNSKKFTFLHTSPIKESTKNSLRNYWLLFRNMLFENLQMDLEVNSENLELIKKRLSLMKLFSTIEKFSEDEEIQESTEKYESFVSDFETKIESSLKLCEKIFIESIKIPKTPKTERFIQAAIKIVFNCPKLREELKIKINTMSQGRFNDLLNTQNYLEILSKVYLQLNWA